jgi:molybdenum cofactor cytidylyltransferase
LSHRVIRAARQAQPAPPERRPIVGILLAAGAGTRFDRSGKINKLPLACHAARLLAAHCAHVIAVTSPGDSELRDWLTREGCHVVTASRSGEGLGYSLAAGVSEARRRFDPQALVVLLADLPVVRAQTMTKLLAVPRNAESMVAPCYDGQRGFPLVCGTGHFARLAACSDDRSVEQMLSRSRPTLIDVDDPGIVQDVDFPPDLVTLRFDALG